MKVVMLVTNSLKKDPRVQKEAQIAIDHNIDVTVVCCEDEFYDEAFLEGLPYKVKCIKVESCFLGCRFKKNFFRTLFEMMVYAIKLNPDVVHSNDFSTLGIGYVVSRSSKARLVYDSHELFIGLPSVQNSKIKTFIVKTTERYVCPKADVIAVSHASANILKEQYSLTKVNVVTNCPFCTSEEKLLSKNEGFEALYQGIFGDNRGYEELIDSSEFLDAGVSIVVRGYGKNEEELKSRAKKFHNIVFDDPVEIQDLVPAASKSMVGVVLTKPVGLNYENTISNKFFEYLSAGLPIILSNVKEHVYLNNKYHIGIVLDEVSPKAIADGINLLYRDKTLYNRLANNVKVASKELCWENEGQKLISIYKKGLS